MRINSNSALETIDLGKKFSRTLSCGDVVVLEGDLGGGKTTFVKGILKGLGYKRRVLSPSFTLVREYKVRVFNVYHLDLYRLKHIDVFDIGIEDLLSDPKSVALIEWGEKIKDDLDKYIKVEFSFLGQKSRKLIFSSRGYSKSRSFLK